MLRHGKERVSWIRSRMPLMQEIRTNFEEQQPFSGHKIGVSLHVDPKTAVLLEVLKAGGANVVGTGNYGSTQDDIAAFLNSVGITTIGRRDDTYEVHLNNVKAVVDAGPDILLDNGGDLAVDIIERGAGDTVIGGTEETTSGGDRLRQEMAGRISFPTIVINDSPLKSIAENKHAVGQSVVESFMRITNLMIPGRRIVVLGFGWCGRGIAKYFKSFGAKVAVVETNEIKALEAALDGFRVGPLSEFTSWGEVFVTATGRDAVLTADIMKDMSNGAVLMNAGHFPREIEVEKIRALAVTATEIDGTLSRLEFGDGKHVVLVADGRMVNLAGKGPKGNSIESMDIGFTLQALSLLRIVEQSSSLPSGPQPVPDDINRRIAGMMLVAMGSRA